MQAWMIAFSVGIIASGFLSFIPPLSWIAGLCLGTVLLHCHAPLRLPAAMLAGSCWFLLWAHGTLVDIWPQSRAGEERWAQGVVWSLPEANSLGGARFRLRLTALCEEAGKAPCQHWQSEATPRLTLVSVYQPLALAPGQHWQFLLHLKTPHGSANPGGFAYDSWMLHQGIRINASVRAAPQSRLLAEAEGRPWFTRLRYHFSTLMDHADGGLWLQASLLKALTLGDKSGISDAQWTLFTALGLNHLMVISGLHIGLVASVSYRCALYLSKCFPVLCRRWGAPRCALVFSALAALLYSGLAGFSLPALRALIMTLVCLAAIGLQRQCSGRNVLVLALMLILVGDPLAPQSAGFWLSFMAVAILMSQSGRQNAAGPYRWLQVVGLQALLCIGMLPVMGFFFQQSSLFAPVANLAAIPWVGLLVVPLALLGMLLLPLWYSAGFWLLNFSDWMLQAFMDALQWADTQFTLVMIDVPQSFLLMGVLSLVALACLLVRRPLLRLVCVTAVGLLLILPRSAARAPGSLQLIVLDVGQGLAVIIDTGSQLILYDSGPRFSDSFDAGGDVVLPALRKLGLGSPDVIMISHADLDHAGGLPALEQAFPEALFLGPETSLFSAGLRSEACAGQQWSSNGSQFSVLHPYPGGSPYRSTNNSSCVLQLQLGATRILLPGDIEREVEMELLTRYPELQAEVVIAPHHGSLTSSTWPFVKNLRPQLVVFSSGYLSRFGHPHPAVQYRYRALGAQAYNTARSGAVLLDIDAVKGVTRVREYRREHQRFWHGMPPASRPATDSVRGGGVW